MAQDRMPPVPLFEKVFSMVVEGCYAVIIAMDILR